MAFHHCDGGNFSFSPLKRFPCGRAGRAWPAGWNSPRPWCRDTLPDALSWSPAAECSLSTRMPCSRRRQSVKAKIIRATTYLNRNCFSLCEQKKKKRKKGLTVKETTFIFWLIDPLSLVPGWVLPTQISLTNCGQATRSLPTGQWTLAPQQSLNLDELSTSTCLAVFYSQQISKWQKSSTRKAFLTVCDRDVNQFRTMLLLTLSCSYFHVSLSENELETFFAPSYQPASLGLSAASCFSLRISQDVIARNWKLKTRISKIWDFFDKFFIRTELRSFSTSTGSCDLRAHAAKLLFRDEFKKGFVFAIFFDFNAFRNLSGC